jgi:hypothetical protein
VDFSVRYLKGDSGNPAFDDKWQKPLNIALDQNVLVETN